MVLSLGPTLANAFLYHYEKLWLDHCPSEFKPMYTEDLLTTYLFCLSQKIIY